MEEKDVRREMNKDKLKALQLTLDKIDKDFGKGAIMRMSDKAIQEVPSISTGSIGLDAALGIGGFPRGRVVEIYGPESSGKTTLAIHAIAEAQKAVVSLRSLMPSMPSTALMLRNWAWIWIIFMSPSRTTGNRPLRLLTR
jgi:predicted ATP-dependent serine protease